MGVKGFAAWLARTYPECFVPQSDGDGGNRALDPSTSAASTSTSMSSSGRRPAWASRPSDLPSTPSSPSSSSRPVAPASFDHVYVDMASLLHTALRQAKSEGHFALLLFSRLDALLRATRPRKSVVLALDGPAPLAKLLTQRSRRRRAGRKATRESKSGGDGGDESSSSSDSGSSPSSISSLNSLSLTPGSPLMNYIGSALEYFICARLSQGGNGRGGGRTRNNSGGWSSSSPSSNYSRVQWELSGADVPGEGELKLLSRLRSHWWRGEEEEGGGGENEPEAAAEESGDEKRRRRRRRQRRQTHCVVGGDSDLLLMASLADPADGEAGSVFVMADEPAPPSGSSGGRGGRFASGRGRGRGGRGPPSSSSFHERKRRVFSVDALDAAIARDLNLDDEDDGDGPDPSSSPSRRRSRRKQQSLLAARRDLALLAIVSCGNDYLPPTHGIDLKSSWKAYKAAVTGKRERGEDDETTTSTLSRSIVVPPPPVSSPSSSSSSASINPDLLAAVVKAAAAARGWRPPKKPSSKGKKTAAGNSNGGGSDDGSGESNAESESANESDGDGGDFRPRSDPRAYLIGAAWVLGMYCSGTCRDWRFCYDRKGPDVEELLLELEREEREKKEATTTSSYSSSASSPPLAPAVCAAALLPPGPAGAAAAPAPLRPLWDVSPGESKGDSDGSSANENKTTTRKQRDPVVEELFTVCETCESLSDKSGAAQSALLEALAARKRLELQQQQEALGTATVAAVSSSPPEAVAAAAAAVDFAIDAARDAVRAVARARNAHVRAKHPYAPFPLQKLEAAVGEALHDALSSSSASAASNVDDDGSDNDDESLSKEVASSAESLLRGFGKPARYWIAAGRGEGGFDFDLDDDGSPLFPLPSPPSSRLPVLEPPRWGEILKEELPEEVIASASAARSGSKSRGRSSPRPTQQQQREQKCDGGDAVPPLVAAKTSSFGASRKGSSINPSSPARFSGSSSGGAAGGAGGGTHQQQQRRSKRAFQPPPPKAVMATSTTTLFFRHRLRSCTSGSVYRISCPVRA